MLKFVSIYFSFIFISFSSLANNQAASAGYLHGFDDIDGIRFAYRPVTQSFDTQWLGNIDVYLEGSVNYWRYKQEGIDETDTNFTVALTPVIVKQLGTIYNQYPVFLEAGIGVSVVSDQHFAGKDIGSHYQFEDKLGLIVALKESESIQHNFAMRFIHYSNGGLNDDNPGLDFINLAYIAYF
ncbi:MAG: acyloxyacyl hydrolase [Alteromonadaceae bacterium]|nr:acyloxyacyl hydrolase [Alteromonadaceae bacterium]